MKNKEIKKGEIIIYKTPDKKVEIKVALKEESIWLSLNQIAQVFSTNKSGISRHIRNIYQIGELSPKSTVAKIATVQIEGGRSIKRLIEYYSLDMILAVGYRVNSKIATQFRIWATKTLKNYLLKGYVVNEKRLLEANNKFKELQNTVAFLQKKSQAKVLTGQGKELLTLLADYAKTLTLLDQYDKNKLKGAKGEKAVFVLKYEHCLNIIDELRKELAVKKEASNLFGNEVNNKFESVVKNLYQTFSGKELYRTIEAKAAHLLYLTIKDHPFTDGNKRIASFLFIYFLDKNDYLYKINNEKKINDNALVILALLIAESEPKEKEQMIALITQLLK